MKTNFLATIENEEINPELIAQKIYNVTELVIAIASNYEMTKKHTHNVNTALETSKYKKAANEIRKDYSNFIIADSTDFEICIGFWGSLYTLAYNLNSKVMLDAMVA